MSGNRGEREQFNYGIAALKVLLCFVVITCHGWDASQYSMLFMPLDALKPIAVPLFLIISFYYMYKGLKEGKVEFLKQRIFRLGLPYIVWPIIVVIIYYIAQICGHPIIEDLFSGIIDQILFGDSPIIYYFWFLHVSLVFSVLFFLLYRIDNSVIRDSIYIVLFLFSLVWAYSGLNQFFVENFPGGVHMRNNLLMFPFAISGLFWAKNKKILTSLQGKWLYSIGITVLAGIVFILQTKLILPTCVYDVYGGVYLILVSNLIFAFINTIDFSFLPDGLRNVIRSISKYTLGIYCIHGIVLRVVENIYNSLGLGTKTISGCIICFLFSLLICMIIGKIPNKYVSMLVS